MKLQNEFSDKTKMLFLRHRWCMNCGRSDYPIELHHIFGRVSALPVNCSRLCSFKGDSCHETIGDIHNVENETKLLQATLSYLSQCSYKFTSEDINFIQQNGFNNEGTKIGPAKVR